MAKTETDLRQDFGDVVVEQAKKSASDVDIDERKRQLSREESRALPSIKEAMAPLVKAPIDVGKSRSVEEIADRLERRETAHAVDISAQKKRRRQAKRDHDAEERVLGAIATGHRPNVNESDKFGVRHVDDPHRTGRKVLAATSLRDDPIGRLHKRKQIDDAQMQAGRKWQEDWEEAEIGGARAIDPSREHVDGGHIPEPWNERQMAATQRLARCSRWLGMEGEALVRDVLGNRMSLAQCAIVRGMNPKDDGRDIKYLGRRLRECLETLAHRLGLAIKGPSPATYNDDLAVLGDVAGCARLFDAVRRAIMDS